jgi:hypothetical protein
MCDDHAASSTPTTAPPGLTRRNFMHATIGAAAAAALLRRFPRLPLTSAARPVAIDGTSAYSMAMHIHSSFSEQTGTMDSQLFQAAANSVDVLWWTDHDHRMEGTEYRDTVHFTSLDHEKGGPGQGGAWNWTQLENGQLAGGSGGGIATNPCSPNDPVAGGSMQLTAKAATGTAKYGYFANSKPARWNYRDNLTGQTLSIDVLLTSGWTEGYLELLIGTSYHEAAGGRPAGKYSLSYRFVPPGGRAGRAAQGNAGVITIPVTPSGGNSWTTESLTPCDDIAALWPDLDYRDFALWELTLSAVSTGDLVGGYFDYLRFKRKTSGEAFLEQQIEMEAALASKYPGVTQRQGLEVSWQAPHVNWFGGDVVVPDYGDLTHDAWATYLQHTLVPQIHAGNGLVSYNHPYGYGFGKPELPVAKQNELLAKVARKLLPTASSPAALGADLMEVGYNLREGVDLAHHVALWDVMSRNAVFLTGNGTSDDHFGQDWRGLTNNWVTSAWAASTSESDLLTALAAGRAWCGSLSAYRGSLDLMIDGTCPMGSASISSATSRRLSARATAIPANGSLQILQGAVDYAGTAGLTANTQVIASYTNSQLASGSVTQSIDTSTSSFIRTQVLDATGTVIGLSNPAWLLRNTPPHGIPAPRTT